MKTLLALLIIATSLEARPTVDLVPAADLNPTLRTWRREKAKALNYRINNEPELDAFYHRGDVAMWEEYFGQPLAVGDLIIYVSSTTGKPIIRELASITPLRTTRNFPVPPDKIIGIVRRMVRVTP